MTIRPPSTEPVEAGAYGAPLHLIGFEIRSRRPDNGQIEELQMLALDIELPASAQWFFDGWTLPCTLHTTRGDVAVEIRGLPR